jgi:hypothetical protein
MGVGLKNLLRLEWLFEQGFIPARAAVLEIGAQTLGTAGFEDEVERVFEILRARAGQTEQINREAVRALASDGKMSRFFNLCGSEYHALDLFAEDNVTLFDLNLHDIPSRFRNHFDLVTNLGTTEHVFDQVRCFRTMHDAAKVGGIIYSDVPMGGFLYHCCFLYTPLFFQHLALANDYEVVFDYYGLSAIRTETPAEMLRGGYPRTYFRDANIEVAFRKKFDAPFQLPLDIGASGITKDVWNGEPPYRIIRDATAVRELGQASLANRTSTSSDLLAQFGTRTNNLETRLEAIGGRLEEVLEHMKESRDCMYELRNRIGELQDRTEIVARDLSAVSQQSNDLAQELRSFKSYFDFARPFARFFRRTST